jgi:lysophospholipase L1-like esterase
MTEWITTPIDPELVFGALDLERTARGMLPHRLPGWARDQFPDEYLARVEAQPSGVRLAFRTSATAIELEVLSTKTTYAGAPTAADGKLDLVVDGRLAGQASITDGNVRVIDLATQTEVAYPGPSVTMRFNDLPAREKEVEIWLPQTETTELIALRTDAPIRFGLGRLRRVWLHHGSSISQGSTAASPSATWPALAASRGDVDLINLGFSGNALLDPFTARAMRDTPADLISIKIGINLANTDLMRRRAFAPAVHGFLDTVREGHPHAPLIVVSPILSPIQEHTPGPIAPVFDGPTISFTALGDSADPSRLTLTMIRDELRRIVAQRAVSDPNLHYLDGRSLYGDEDFAEIPLPDQLHPDPEGHRRLGERFAEAAFTPDGPFAAMV